MQLAAIVHAGAQGIEDGLETPEATAEDLSLLSTDALAKRGYARLPSSLEAALALFTNESTVTDWFPDGFADIYVKHKQGELAFLNDKTDADIHDAYRAAY